MGAGVQLVASNIGIIRAGREYHQHGDPYEFTACIVITGSECEIMAGLGTMTMQTYYAIKIELRNLGITKVNWERIKGQGKSVRHGIEKRGV